MKKILTIFFLIGMAIFAGCSSDSGEDNNDENINLNQEETNMEENIIIQNQTIQEEENLDIIFEDLIEDDESQEIGSLI